jgi:hypothetical protein
MVFIYALQLDQCKYYIGKTNNPTFRLDSHFSSNGCNWTKKYKPLNVLEIIPDCDDYDEDKHTLKYMEKFGINNVRGGSFCEIKLNETNVATIKQMICGSTDKCYICGSNDHFVNDCKKTKKDISPKNNEQCKCVTSFLAPHRKNKCALKKVIEIFDDEDDNIENFVAETTLQNKQVVCFRCGREGHYATTCYAKTIYKSSNDRIHEDSDEEDDGEEDDDDDYDEEDDDDEEDGTWCCEKCNKEFNSEYNCNLHEQKCSKTAQVVCFRCGRGGHYATKCYAKMHIKGYNI